MSHNLFKISLKYLHPIDAGFHYSAYNIMPYFKERNYTPNQLTTCSFIYGLISCYFLYIGYPILTICLSLISYFFDVMDGVYARRYNLTSKFGDYYDHITDIIQYVLYIGILIYKYNLLDYKKSCILLIIQVLLASVYIGCVEKIYSKNNSETLSIFKKTCIIHPHKYIHKLKYLSQLNTLIVLYIISFILVKNSNK